MPAADIEHRALRPGDIASCLRLSTEAGWNQTAEDWALVIASGPADGLFAAGRLIATAAAIHHGAGHGWIAMVLVDPAERGRGHAKRLLGAMIDRLAGEGRGAGLDATALGQPLYEKLGFVAIGTFTRYAVTAAPLPAPSAPSTGNVIRPATAADAAAMAAYDAPAFGADRAAILAHLIARVPSAAHVALREGALAGYVLARDGVRATQIGSLVADDGATASALLQAALGMVSGPVFIDAADAHAPFCTLLQDAGFAAQRTFTRMVLGPARTDDPQKVFAIVGPEFG
ncbi:MAG: GNAT family N-acetyltransferase [Acuticoccus sp.]